MAAVNGAAIVAAARAWLGVRFRHQGRSREGIDCAGLVICVARELGLVASEFDISAYGRRPDGRTLVETCERHLTRVVAPAAGDVLVFRIVADPQHLAIAGDYFAGGLSLVHAYAPTRGVVETRFDEAWRARLVAAYRFPEAV